MARLTSLNYIYSITITDKELMKPLNGLTEWTNLSRVITAGLIIRNEHTIKINLPRDREGYNRFVYMDKKTLDEAHPLVRGPKLDYIFFACFFEKEKKIT